MILYPAIDLLDGRAVRLRQGRREDVTDFGDPVTLARRWREKGAQWLHLVDLEAAFDGQSRQLPLLERIVAAFGGPVELGGGLRSMEDIRLRMEAGVRRCIIGTAAAENPDLVREACERWPGRIAVGIDGKNGRVALRGWVATASPDAPLARGGCEASVFLGGQAPPRERGLPMRESSWREAGGKSARKRRNQEKQH